MTDSEIFKTSAVVNQLPDILGGKGAAVPQSLVAATIISVGTFEDDSLVETGGLVIDYMPAGTTETRRAVFAFNDVAMWVAADMTCGGC